MWLSAIEHPKQYQNLILVTSKQASRPFDMGFLGPPSPPPDATTEKSPEIHEFIY